MYCSQGANSDTNWNIVELVEIRKSSDGKKLFNMDETLKMN